MSQPLTRAAAAKIKTLAELIPIREQLRLQGLTLVFTNGCFDLLHAGHIHYLERARAQGDRLIVALNSDASVTHLKGPGRPILAQGDRCRILAALECVDWVAVFREGTPRRIIQKLLPDVLAKGGDWPLDQIVGRTVVEKAGGKVISVQFEKGKSTSSIIQHIRNLK